MPADRAAKELEAMSTMEVGMECFYSVSNGGRHSAGFAAVVAELQRRIRAARDEGRREAAKEIQSAAQRAEGHAEMYDLEFSLTWIMDITDRILACPAPVGESA